jgi:5-methyltetrahydropteroyltriglutamate--homocysteine methyltransferase
MLRTSLVGYPRIGAQRELKKWTEAYFNRKITQTELLEHSRALKQQGLTLSPQMTSHFMTPF